MSNEGLKFRPGKMKLSGIYRAKVEDTADPSLYGRIRARVYPFFSGLQVSDIPWARPAMSPFEGAGDGFGMLTVPKAGTFVFVFFEAGDPYQPVYFASAQTATYGIPAQAAANYPNRLVWRTQNGIEVYIDTSIDEIKILQPTGTYILVSPNGRVTVYSIENIVLNAVNDVIVTAGRDVSIDAGRDVNVTAQNDITIHAVGNISITADGTGGGALDVIDIEVTGNVKATVQGNVNASVSGTVAVAVGGEVTVSGSKINLNP
jgi:type VI secretion system secreted protein VgrG